MARVEPEFEKCREAINGAVQTFERLITAGRKNLWSEFFNDLTEKADQIVAEHFGENDRITEKIKRAFQNRQSTMGERLQAQSKEHMETLQKSLSQAMGRLIQDVQRVEFQQRITFDANGQKALYSATGLDMDLGLKDWGSIAFNVGSYAMTGAGIGTGFYLGIGTAIGAAIGAVIGLLVSVMHIFTSKEKRIRKAQAQVQEKIDDVRYQVMDQLSDETNTLVTSVRNEVQETTLSQIDAIHISLTRPLDIMQQQIALMTHLKNQLEKMPHGTIQAIRR
jgi:gas vesicle protein/DNA-binding ferritin-like protein